MPSYIAGQRLLAETLNNYPVDETEDSGLTAATGFSVVSFSGRRVFGFTTIVATLTRTGASIAEIASNTGNITDTAIATLPTGWQPPETMIAMWGNGFNDGECIINTGGVMTVRTTSGTNAIANGTNVAVSAEWITG